MPLNPTSKFLVDTVEALPLLDGRFEDLKLMNYDSAQDQQRGCFSLVFRAIDTTTGKPVALKFFDPQRMMDVYRLTAFRREHSILEELVGEVRCLQLASSLQKYDLHVPTAAGVTLPLPCEYFAIEWIDDEIDKYFLCQEDFSALDRLKLFLAIALAVEALHSRGIFHRDLKPDNLRLSHHAAQKQVIAIDLGAAAKYMSPPFQNPYFYSVGAPAYASAEAHCGLAGNRLLASYTDIFALGCMLFELFNADYHFKAIFARNQNYQPLLAVLGSGVDHTADDRAQKASWDKLIHRLSNSYVTASITNGGNDVPSGIVPILDDVLSRMTHIDYRNRPSIKWSRDRISSAIKVLSNDRLYQFRLERAREQRRRKFESVKSLWERVAIFKAKALTEKA